jgi:hypothetical protein
MEHSGFQTHNEFAYRAMSEGWPSVVERLERVSAELDGS